MRRCISAVMIAPPVNASLRSKFEASGVLAIARPCQARFASMSGRPIGPSRRRRLKKGETSPAPELPGPMDHVFPGEHKKLFNGILDRANLKLDRDNKLRTAYSLRHTYICMRLMEEADTRIWLRPSRSQGERI